MNLESFSLASRLSFTQDFWYSRGMEGLWLLLQAFALRSQLVTHVPAHFRGLGTGVAVMHCRSSVQLRLPGCCSGPSSALLAFLHIQCSTSWYRHTVIGLVVAVKDAHQGNDRRLERQSGRGLRWPWLLLGLRVGCLNHDLLD